MGAGVLLLVLRGPALMLAGGGISCGGLGKNVIRKDPSLGRLQHRLCLSAVCDDEDIVFIGRI